MTPAPFGFHRGAFVRWWWWNTVLPIGCGFLAGVVFCLALWAL